MLKVPQLDDITYEQMMEKAIQKIPTMTEQWTDFNYHDPGITVLQTYAWLVDMLNYYMNATGDIHILKYLKLLGMTPKPQQVAKAYVSVETQEKQIELIKGTRLLAGDCVFELDENYSATPNKFVSFINEVDGKGIDLTMFAGVDGDYANIFAKEFKEQCIGYFGFEQTLQGTNAIYISVEENENRNDFTKEFAFGELEWQYYTGDSWKPVENVVDGTCGLLKSGMLEVTVKDSVKQYMHPAGMRAAYYIRCVLKKNYYDVLPRIGGVYAEPFVVSQKDSICRVEELFCDGNDVIEIPCYIRENDYLLAALQQENGEYKIIFEGQPTEDDGCEIRRAGNSYTRVISFEKQENKPKEGTKLQVMMIREDFLSEIRTGFTNGCIHQEIPFEYEGISHIAVNLWSRKDDGFYYETWNYTDDILSADYKDRVFSYDKERKVIVFGDGIHGVLPMPGLQVCISELEVSRFGNGNVLQKEIQSFEDPIFSVYKIHNPENATGGRNAETMKEMLERLSDLLLEQNRMVAPQDYVERVMQTPGLIIELVKVVSGKRYAEIHDQVRDRNEVVVVVKPYSQENRPVLSETYVKRIAEYIEKYRLINTKVSIVSPSYVGLEVHGKIALSHESADEKEQVEAWIYNQLQCNTKPEHFGKPVIVGKLFSELEAQVWVKQVHSLSVERIGHGAYKNERRDVILYEDALSYVSSIDIEFV